MRKGFKKIRLLVKEGDRTVWRTFDGKWLLGGTVVDRGEAICIPSGTRHPRWRESEWCVAQGARGKFAAYRRTWGETHGTLQVYESLSGMRGEIPDWLLDKAEIAAGVRSRPEDAYPEEPLDV